MNGGLDSWSGTRVMGTCKSWKDQWGFLTTEGMEGDIFVHLRENPGLGGGLQPGEQVEFEITTGSGANSSMAKAYNVQKLSAEPTGSYEGVVTSFREGWGLIESSSLSEKLYCGLRDNPQLKSKSLIPGDQVYFDLGTNSTNGKPKAINVTLKLCEQSELVGQRVRASVKSFQDGWGFANSDRFPGTIMLGKKNMSASGIGFLSPGDIVEFEVAAGPSGKFEALKIQAVQMQGFMPRMASAPPPRMAASGPRDRSRSPYGHANGTLALAQPAPPTTPHPGRMYGTVRTFRHGWGFLTSPQLTGDIYVNLVQSPKLEGEALVAGEAVTFELQHRASADRNNGSQAVNVQRTSAASQPPPPRSNPPPPNQYTITPAYMQGQGPGFSQGNKAGKSTFYHGTMAMVREKDGWGWIKSPTVNGDIFFGMRDNPQLLELPKLGDQLSFEIAVDPKSGRNKALKAAHSLAGQRVQGVVKSFKDGWGFATSEGIEGNVLIGKKSLQASGVDGTSLMPGDWLEFELKAAAKGYEAQSIRKM